MLEKKSYNQNFQNFFLSSFKVLYTKTQKFLVLQTKDTYFKFIAIPNSITINKKEDLLLFETISADKTLYQSFLNFQKLLSYTFKQFNKKFKKTLVIKGLGMRINYLAKTHTLELKLGFSNLIFVSVPLSLKIYKNKNLLTIEGYNHSLVGNFAYLIQSLRYPDSYKGKGLWYKNQEYKLKLIKKT